MAKTRPTEGPSMDQERHQNGGGQELDGDGSPKMTQTGELVINQIEGKRKVASQPEATEQTTADHLPGDGLYPQGLPTPGAPAGLEPSELSERPSVSGSVRVTCIDYCPEKFRVQEVANLPDFLKQH